MPIGREPTEQEKKEFCRTCVRSTFLVAVVVTIVQLSIGGYWWSRFDSYKHSTTGKLLEIYVEPARLSPFGERVFYLIEKYNLEEKGFNCTIFNEYQEKDEAEKQLVRHTHGHANLKVQVHGHNCITKSLRRSYKYNAINCFCWASVTVLFFALVVAIARANITDARQRDAERMELTTAPNKPKRTEREEQRYQEGYRAGQQSVRGEGSQVVEAVQRALLLSLPAVRGTTTTLSSLPTSPLLVRTDPSGPGADDAGAAPRDRDVEQGCTRW